MMRSLLQYRTHPVARALPLTVLALGISTTQPAAQESPALVQILKRIPVKPSEKEEVARALLELGEEGVRELCGMLKDEPLDGKACHALHGITHRAGRAGAEAERRMVAGVFADVITSDATVAARSYLAGELRLIGKAESIGPLGILLTHPELCEPGAQALVAIGGEDAATQVRNALPRTRGKARITLVTAAGRLRDRKAVPLLLKEIRSEDRFIRQAANYALANIGDPEAGSAIIRAIGARHHRERHKARHYALRFARRLVENNEPKAAARICHRLQEVSDPDDPRFQGAVFFQLVSLLDEEEVPGEIARALASKNPAMRNLALRVAAERPGAEITRQLARQIPSMAARDRAAILGSLRQRGDAAGLPAALAALKDKEESVRIAAIAAVGGLGKRDAAPALIGFLDKHEKEAAAARAALKAMGDPELNGALIAMLPGQQPEVAARLLGVIGARNPGAHLQVFLAAAAGREDRQRLAALRVLASRDDPMVVPAVMELLAGERDQRRRSDLEKSVLEICRRIPVTAHEDTGKLLVGQYGVGEPAVRAVVLKALGCTARGYPGGLEAVRAALEDRNDGVRDAALRSMADWPSADPIADLLDVAGKTENNTHHVLALRGHIKMIGMALSAKTINTEEAVKRYRAAMETARHKDEKKRVLAGISGLKHPAALELAVAALDREGLESEAAAAAVRIGQQIRNRHKAETAAAMEKVLKITKNRKLRQKAQELAGQVKKK